MTKIKQKTDSKKSLDRVQTPFKIHFDFFKSFLTFKKRDFS